jgi:hypothetical protein
VNEEAMAQWGLSRQTNKQTNKHKRLININQNIANCTHVIKSRISTERDRVKKKKEFFSLGNWTQI